MRRLENHHGRVSVAPRRRVSANVRERGLRRMRKLEHHPGRLLVPLLASVALVGYLAGHGISRTAPDAGRTLTMPAGGVLLHYPSSWRAAAGPSRIPGLVLAHAVTLAPGADAGRAGLVVGQLPAGESDPVPQGFMAIAHQQRGPEVVNLPEAQAYRYAGLRVSGFRPTLTMYTIPTPGAPSTALACYAPSASSEELATCEQVVSTLTLAGQSQNYSLTPVPAYAHQLQGAITAMDRERLGVRGEMALHPAPPTLQRLAARLGSIFGKAASGLSGLEASPAAGSAQAGLAASLWRARDAYAALASLATGRDAARLSSARARIAVAESDVNVALERFAWLGYARP